MMDNFAVWNIFVGPGHLHDRNDTNMSDIDILTKNCVLNYDTIACLRGTLFCFLSTVTGLLCAGRIINLHLNGHPNYYQYIVFYLAVLQCFAGTTEWIVGWNLHAALTIVYLHIVQGLLVTYFYLKLAFRIKFHSDRPLAHFTTFVSSLFLVYFTSFLIIGFWYANVAWEDCHANYWLFLSVGQLFIIQFMLLAFMLIVSKVNSISAQESLKRAQKRGLWLLLVAFEFSAITNVAYHLILFLLADEESGCSGVFLHKQLIYTPVRIAFKVAVELLPVWAMLYVFKPVQRTAGDRHSFTISTTTSSEGALLDPSVVRDPFGRPWRRKRRVLRSFAGRTLLPGVVPFHGNVRIPRRNKGLRQTASLPASLRKLRSPPLATIPEEPTSSGHNSVTNSVSPHDEGSSVEPLLNVVDEGGIRSM